MGMGGGGSGKPSHGEIFRSLAKTARDKAEKEKREEDDRETLRLAGRGRAANILAGDTEDSLGVNKKFLGSAGV